MPGRVLLILGLVAPLVVCGCKGTRANPTGPVITQPEVGEEGPAVIYVNPFEPTSARLTPHTALIANPGGIGTRIEAYFELRDVHGDPVKALGEVVFELYTSDIDGSEVQARRWRLDLNDLERNAQSYDRIVRAYRATLDDVPDSGSGAMRLELRYTTSGGTRLSSERRLR
jgi:hypothetical protein